MIKLTKKQVVVMNVWLSLRKQILEEMNFPIENKRDFDAREKEKFSRIFERKMMQGKFSAYTDNALRIQAAIELS